MRVLFWGTPDYAVPSLQALLGEGHEIVGVVTQPDRPAGRGQALRESPVKQAAREQLIPVLQPEKARGEEFLAEIRALRPEISVVIAYGQILRPEVLEVPERGSINAHASLLPELRGAAPINWAIIRGYQETGVTIIRMNERMDAGGLLESRWEDPDIAVNEGRPRRRLYSVTPLGVSALARARAEAPTPAWRPGMVT